MSTVTRRVPVVCGVDLGSTNVKVVLMDERGAVVARATRPTMRRPGDASVDASALFGEVEALILEACAGERMVVAVCVAGVGEDGVLVDEAMRPLMRAQAWFDPRRHDVYARLRERLAEDDGFGVGLDPSRSLVGWAWAASRSSSRGATAWLALADYVSARWSGVPFMSDTIAARTAAWRPAARAWDAPRVDATLGSAGLLPPVLPAGVVVGAMLSGRLRTEGAISDGAVVVAGGHDHPIAGWAVGVMSPGAVLDSMGTAEVVVALSPSPPHGRRDEVDCGPGIGRSGSTLLRVEELARNAEWAARDPEVAEALGALIGGSLAPDDAVHGDGFVPGERGGGRPRYRADVGGNARSRASAVLGALARRGAAAVDAVRAQAGGGGPTFMTGGWTRSAGWAAIKRSVSRAPLHAIREPEVTAVGAALLAARAIAWETEAADVLRPVEVR